MDDTTYMFLEKFIGDNFCLLYDGDINDEITKKIIDLSEYNFESKDGFAQSKKKVSFLLAECFQNIIRHGGKIDINETKNFGYFLTRNISGIHFITSGNLIKNVEINDLKNQLDKINNLNKESLKALYVDVLSNTGISQKGGAGLGLIEIARKSGRKIEFVFDDFKDDLSLFYNQITINTKGKNQDTITTRQQYISEAIEYHKNMLAENILMIQKGDFSHSSISPVLEILRKNLPELFQKKHPRKDVYHVLVEVLQNVSKYGLEINNIKEGIFLIRKKASLYVISAGNFIRDIHIEKLKSHLELLNKLNKKELKSLYLTKLKENDSSNGVIIELIEIAKRSKEPIQYSFNEPKPNQFFFTISVTV